MSERGNSREPFTRDRLRGLNSQVLDDRVVDCSAVSAVTVGRLEVVRSERHEERVVRVALIADNRLLAESVDALITSMGWESESIWAGDLETSTRLFWDLIIVATNGDTIQIAPICALASRDARQRVLVVSTNPDPQIIADALNSGADDYVIAPFDSDECRARMRVLVKRSGIPSRQHSRVVWLEPLLRTVGIGSRHATLSSREWALLTLLIEANEEAVASSELEVLLWGSSGRQSTLASVVSRLRDRLQTHRLEGIDIVTVRGIGYAIRFRDLDTSRLYRRSDAAGGA